MVRTHGIHELRIDETPLAIVDTETTGLSPNGDRIVELAVVRLEPRNRPEVILDTLVNPGRTVTATEIHGISDADVVGAPTFGDVSPLFMRATSDCVLAAYNVYFDVKFLLAELAHAGVRGFPPYLCLMYLRPMLGLGARCTLGDACKKHGITAADQHVAAADALASSELWPQYLARMSELNVSTFGELAQLKRYKFTQSFSSPPIDSASIAVPSVRLKSRHTPPPGEAAPRMSRVSAISEYWESLKSALADYELSNEEISYLKFKKEDLQIDDESMRWLHARAFSGILANFSDDHRVDHVESELLHSISKGLREIGWSPGDPVTKEEASGRRRGLLGWLQP